ncbi:response regulator [Sinosporangium siamense]|uniref:DNA-binding response regulator n=1 Tax=Sinosporangium siamense TaxID=1367973 RepID=A0A919RLX6_9ACTN|nr:response regulator transcription factor [Sinosporangium siamense]GII94389.1 DNA-binding response regulator [Sinosporangium siamense]
MKTRVLIADDHAMVRAGFGALLAAEPDLDVVGDAANGEQAVAEARRLRPDVVLMDVRMPMMDGLRAAKLLLDPPPGGHRPRVLMLTTFDLDEYVYEALRAGASGFLLKDAPPQDLIAAVRVVASGDALLAPSVTKRLIDEVMRSRLVPPLPSVETSMLTRREAEVLVHIARGLTNSEIAASLVIGEQTVKTHIGRILAKLNLRDRGQAIIFAYESGLVVPRSGE